MPKAFAAGFRRDVVRRSVRASAAANSLAAAISGARRYHFRCIKTLTEATEPRGASQLCRLIQKLLADSRAGLGGARRRGRCPVVSGDRGMSCRR